MRGANIDRMTDKVIILYTLYSPDKIFKFQAVLFKYPLPRKKKINEKPASHFDSKTICMDG